MIGVEVVDGAAALPTVSCFVFQFPNITKRQQRWHPTREFKRTVCTAFYPSQLILFSCIKIRGILCAPENISENHM